MQSNDSNMQGDLKLHFFLRTQLTSSLCLHWTTTLQFLQGHKWFWTTGRSIRTCMKSPNPLITPVSWWVAPLMNWTLCSSSWGQHKILPSSITSSDRSSSRARQSLGRNGIRVGNHRKQRQVLRFLDGFQRVHVSMQRAQGLRFPPWRLPRVPPPLQRGPPLSFICSIHIFSIWCKLH